MTKALLVMNDPYPTERPDVAVLFGSALPGLGLSVDLLAMGHVEAAGAQWTGGKAMVTRTKLGMFARFVAILAREMLGARSARYDVIIVRDLIVLAWLARWLVDRQRLHYWMSYPYPQADRLQASIGLESAHRRFLRRCRSVLYSTILYRAVLPGLAHLFVQSDAMRESVRRRGSRDLAMTVVPMGTDIATVRQFTPAEPRNLAPARPFRLVYLGLLDRSRDPEFLLRVMKVLNEREPGAFALQLIGGTSWPAEFDWLANRIEQMKLKAEVSLTGRLPMRDALLRCSSHDAGLSAIPRGELFDVSSPTKLVEYLALALPVVVNDIPDQTVTIENTGAGICCPMNEDQFAEAIVRLRDDYPRFANAAFQARHWVQRERGYDRLGRKVAAALGR